VDISRQTIAFGEQQTDGYGPSRARHLGLIAVETLRENQWESEK
jgi:hypothetical protein